MAKGRKKIQKADQAIEADRKANPENWIRGTSFPKEGEHYIRLTSNGETFSPRTDEARKLAINSFVALLEYHHALRDEELQKG